MGIDALTAMFVLQVLTLAIAAALAILLHGCGVARSESTPNPTLNPTPSPPPPCSAGRAPEGSSCGSYANGTQCCEGLKCLINDVHPCASCPDYSQCVDTAKCNVEGGKCGDGNWPNQCCDGYVCAADNPY